MSHPFFRQICAALLYTGAAFAQAPYGMATRPAFPAYLGTLPTTAPTFSGTWTAVPVWDNLTFLNPMGIAQIPGSTRMMVWEREGRIYTFEKAAGTSTKTKVLDLSPNCQGWDDCGLLAVAFHPSFATNGYVYVYYNWVPTGTVAGSPTARPDTNTPNRNRLSRFTWNFGTQVLNPASETVLIDQIGETVWHEGGGMFFHPDTGFLHLTIGDDARGQNDQRINTSLHSSMLRIDVDQRGGAISHAPPRAPLPAGSTTAGYFIPNDNPFTGQAGVLEEFWALGLRSPHRATIDPVSKRIFIGDVGEGTKEEISVAEPGDPFGLNFQWNRIEGLGGDLTAPYIGVNKRPIIDYPRSDGRAVIGGYVYRGTEFASDLYGKYIFGDNITNTVWYLDESTTPPTKRPICTVPRGTGPNPGSDYVGISSFGVDAQQELYICQLSSLGGKIYKFSRTGPPPINLPATLSATGTFSSLANLTPRSGLIGYLPNSPLWSDGAVKTRYMGIPDGRTIGFTPTGEWSFPEGSVWVKHFELPVDDNNPAVLKRLETRLLVRNNEGYVYGASYRWRADNSDADLVETGITADVTIAADYNVPGTLTSADIGSPPPGSTALLADGVQLAGGGTDIWGNADSFRFAYETRSGDFDVRTRISSLTQTDLYTKAGLMARESLAPGSRHVFAVVFPSNAARNNNTGGYEFQTRETTNGTSTAIYPPQPQPAVSFPNAWVRLKRAGQVFTSYASTDGNQWTLFATKTLDLPATLFFGAAVTAHAASPTLSTAAFRFPPPTRSQSWYFPGRNDCLQCHTTASSGVLGVNTQQSHRDFTYPGGVTDNQLRTWNHLGLFTTPLQEASLPALTKLASLHDPTASLETRARSYLDSNCSHCHRPGGVNAFWDGRIETSLAAAGLVNGTAQNLLGITGAKIIVPSDVTKSVLHKRLNTATEAWRMPPLSKSVVDTEAVAVLTEWINSISPPPVQPLPAPWLHQDIGNTAFAGDATYSSGNFNLSGSGDDIWGTEDAFHYVYVSLTGDGEISTRVSTLTNTDAWAKMGVMIRETLSANSAHAGTYITPGQGAAFQRRPSIGAESLHTGGPNVTAPLWLRVKREGDLFTSSTSPDGAEWSVIATDTIPMASQVFIGLALTAHNNSLIASAAADSTSVTGVTAGTTASSTSTTARINFQPANATGTLPTGYLVDNGLLFGVRSGGLSYGWNLDNSANLRDRDNPASADQRYDTLAHLQKPGGPWFWEIALPAGRYRIHAVAGDPSFGDGIHHLTAEGTTLLEGPQSGNAPNAFLEGEIEINVTDGRLTLAAGPNGTNTKLAFVDIETILTPWETWRLASFTPAQLADPLISSETADPDQDGLANLLEQAMGTLPLTSSLAALPPLTRNGDTLTMEFPRSTAATDVELHMECSTNLNTWSRTGISETVLTTLNGIQTVRATLALPAGSFRCFARLRVSK